MSYCKLDKNVRLDTLETQLPLRTKYIFVLVVLHSNVIITNIT